MFGLFGVAHFATAQESPVFPIESESYVESEREKPSYSPGGEGEVRFRSASSSATRESETTNTPLPATVKLKTEKSAPSPAKPAADKAQKQDDSILSFNFLYYIIEKYKLSDIID